MLGGIPSHGCIDSSKIESLGGGNADVSNAPPRPRRPPSCGPLPNKRCCRNSGKNEIESGSRCPRRARRSFARRRAALGYVAPKWKDVPVRRWHALQWQR